MAESKKSQAVKEKSHSWRSLRRLLSCKYHKAVVAAISKKKPKKIACSGSLSRNLKESSRFMQRPEPCSPDACNGSCRSLKALNVQLVGVGAVHYSKSSTSMSSSMSSSSLGGSFKGIHLRRLSGCYECQLVVDPAFGISMDPSLRTPILFTCSDCEEVFTKAECFELHQSVAHAVSNLGAEETSRRIVEIIFHSSWMKKQNPHYKIERILKVNNTKKTIARFEEYRNSIICKANKQAKKHPRCIADGNELLRFHCTTLLCSLGLQGSTGLCHGAPQCNVCAIIRDGFTVDGLSWIRTMATSGRAHDVARVTPEMEGERAMLVCRVLAGRVRKGNEAGDQEWDSVAGATGLYSNLDELFVLDSRAILPCFVVVYRSF